MVLSLIHIYVHTGHHVNHVEQVDFEEGFAVERFLVVDALGGDLHFRVIAYLGFAPVDLGMTAAHDDFHGIHFLRVVALIGGSGTTVSYTHLIG